MKQILSVIILLNFSMSLYSQDYSIAPEIWSEPVIFDSVFANDYKWEESPTLNKTMDTIYVDQGDGIYTSHKENGKWTEYVKLNNYINGFGPATRYCSLARQRKRLYFSAFAGYGGWDLWYSDWDTVTNDWGPSFNLGPEINSPGSDVYAYEPCPDTLYVLHSVESTSGPGLCIWDKENNKWTLADKFEYHELGAGNMLGIYLTEDYKKMYYGREYFNRNGLYDDWRRKAYELCVCYWDDTINYWGYPYYLNINTEGIITDTVNMVFTRGAEFQPWISEDGKIMVFASNRDCPLDDWRTDIYVSYLLVDENGNPVSIEKNYDVPKQNELMNNYPNPFNSSTIICFELYKNSRIILRVFDSLGRLICELINSEKDTGRHEVYFNADDYNLASGIYYYTLETSNSFETKKIVHIK